MPVGNVCELRSTVSINPPTNSFTNFNPTWLLIRNEGNIYSINGAELRTSEAGKYLVIYNYRFNGPAGNNERINHITRLTKNGNTPIPGSYSAAYRRDSFNNSMFVTGSVIVDMAANDGIAIQWAQSTQLAVGSTATDTCTLRMVRLTDDTDTAYASYYETTGGDSIGTQSYEDIGFDTTEYETDTNVIEQDSTDDSKFLLKGRIGDKFLVRASVIWQGTTNRTQRVIRAVLDNVGLPGTLAYGYARFSTDPWLATVSHFIVTKKSNNDEELQIQGRRGATGEAQVDGGSTRRPGASGIQIMKLLKTTAVVASHDSVGNQFIFNASFNNLMNGFRNVDEINTKNFTENTNTLITVNNASNYLLIGNIKTTRDNVLSSQRGCGRSLWRLNGISSGLSNASCFTRGNAGDGANTFGGGHNNITIFNLAANTNVGLDTNVTGQPGAQDNTFDDSVGIFLIDTNTLVPLPPVKTYMGPIPQPII